MNRYKQSLIRQGVRRILSSHQTDNSPENYDNSDEISVNDETEVDCNTGENLIDDCDMDCNDDIYYEMECDDEADFSDSENCEYFSDNSDFEVYDETNVNEDVAWLILQFYLRHNLTLSALDDLLRLINKVKTMTTADIPKSKYLFKKVLPLTEEPKIHHYCKRCVAYIGEETKLLSTFPLKTITCNNCNYEYNLKNKNRSAFFLQLTIKNQLKDLVRRLHSNLKLTLT